MAFSLHVLSEWRWSISYSVHDLPLSYWHSDDVSSSIVYRIDSRLILLPTVSRYLELFLGQYYRCGNITLWSRISPAMKGIGISSFLIVTAVTLFYTTIIGMF